MYFLEKAVAPHSSTLAWKIPWMEDPGGLQSMGSLRVRHDWVTSLSLFTFTFHFSALEKEIATHSSVLAWRIPGTGEPGWLPSIGSQSRTRLKRQQQQQQCFFIFFNLKKVLLRYNWHHTMHPFKVYDSMVFRHIHRYMQPSPFGTFSSQKETPYL